jgi:hypothetical protein
MNILMSFSPATAVSIAGSGLRELLGNVDNISGNKYLSPQNFCAMRMLVEEFKGKTLPHLLNS